MQALINDNGNSLKIYNFVHSFDDEKDENPYNSYFNIEIVSGNFQGIGFCEYDYKKWKVFIENLKKMYEFKESKAILQDICYGSQITFEMNRTGHIDIFGVIYADDGMEHELHFRFNTDQTVLPNFITNLEKF